MANEDYFVNLARSHELTQNPVPDILLSRLSDSEIILLKSCEILTAKTKKKDDFSPAREWLLDNLYLIQEQIHSIRRNLPKGYGKALPQLAGSISGYPRVYDIALKIIDQTDGRWNSENLTSYITFYQSVTPLTLGELWAIPITLSVALIENLSRVSNKIVLDRNDRNLANFWADRMIELAGSDPKKIVLAIADMARSEPLMSSAFVSELARRLQGAALALPISWIEQHLGEEGATIEQMVQEDNKSQATDQITVSNSIHGLQHLGEVDWRDFVESMSVVEKILRTDPVDIYSRMDFGTRDRYRHVVEHLSRSCSRSEQEVATAAIRLAQARNIDSQNSHDCHVGFYLIDRGLSQLEKTLDVSCSVWKKICYFGNRWVLQLYLGCILIIIGGITSTLLLQANQVGINKSWLLLLGIVIAICSSQLSVALVNLGATLLVKPEILPRMDFSKGIPPEFCTLVVVPTMLDSADQIESLIEALEIRFLGNRDNNLYFALLTDFNDAQQEHMPEDSTLLNLAAKKVIQLNEKYVRENSDIFFLFHRARQWNANELIWMGRERKRGKLSDLNNLLRGDVKKNFELIIGRTHILPNIKYVITLDSDTQLPRETARQFVGTMAHPLNRPQIDLYKKCVVEGYGILQPRVAEAFPDDGPTRYVLLCGNEFGIDPYTRTVSDVYQDLFHEGSFIGKGIYDVDAFQQVLDRRFPDNRILSHDLLEGCYLRSGFLSDVPLYEKFPSSYLSDSKRRIRWIRGDWQLVSWLLPWVVNADLQPTINPLSFLSKLKLLDNLRRSLVPVALFILLILNWTILSENYYWFGIIIMMVMLPAILNILLGLVRKPHDMLTRQHLGNIMHIGRKVAGQLILYLASLPYEAWYSFKAILITCWRLLISKRNLLEWQTSEQTNNGLRGTAVECIINMWIGPVAALIIVIILTLNNVNYPLLFAVPLLVLWLSFPLIAYWLSKTPKVYEPKLGYSQIRFLHRVARKTWGFFETFITVEDNWLPPDNYQEAPVAVLARRTSPTNIGLSLLANLTAHDFGYINIHQLLERTTNTLKTINKLERYRGHLYNWYNTATLEPLLPRYVSTVDSGNLAGHLLTLRQGLLGLLDEPLLNIRYLDGLEDTFDVLVEASVKPLPKALKNFKKLLNNARISFTNWSTALVCCEELYTATESGAESYDDPSGWLNKLLIQCRALRDEIKLFSNVHELAANATLRELGSNVDIESINSLTEMAFSLAQMDISFLYDKSNHLMTIGFNVDSQRHDPGSYDLLSSEARLGIFVAIAQGQILQESWFALGRLLTSIEGEPILISWSGSMFEYLMPLLIMPTYSGTLLDQTYRAAVNMQISYGKQCGVPWGMSESGFNAFDTQFNYLYRAFGVPGLGLKRGLEDDLVIAPYASAMALMVAPEAACLNLQRLSAEYAEGKFGFYEAIDFTKSRLPRDHKRALVRSFMAHHQGMSLLAFSYLLHNRPMQHRFVSDPILQSTLLLLQERTPKPTATYLKIPKHQNDNLFSIRSEASTRVFNHPNTNTPQVQLLSNDRYHLMLTQAGGGYSRWKNIAMTRWREDSTCDNWGLFSYVCDVTTGKFCSTNYQPTNEDVENFKTVFSEAHAEFRRSAMGLDMHTEVVVSPEDDIELRRIRINNRSKIRRIIEFTSYAEIVLAPQAEDLAQPVFSNLFVETELLTEQRAIIVTRRPLDEQQGSPGLFHLLNVYHNEQPYAVSFETDRGRFVGRCRTVASPFAFDKPGNLSNTHGAVLDPIVAIRCRLTLKPGDLVTFDLITGVAETHQQCLHLIEKYQDHHLGNRVFELAWTYSQVLLHQLNISEADAQLYNMLAGNIIYASHARRVESRILASNRLGQSGLWGYSISGDLPIVLLCIESSVNLELVRQLIQAQAYWRRKGLAVDLVIFHDESTIYRQSLQDQIMNLVPTTTTAEHLGSIIVRPTEQVPSEDFILFQSAARVFISDKRGTLEEQLNRQRIYSPLMPILPVNKLLTHPVYSKLGALPQDLQFFNGLGGFNSTGDEYIIRLDAENYTPAPWVNILANSNFGSLISESGQGYTWIENSHEFRLTPWDNDPIQDSSGEALYIRDEETGLIWSPTALPCRGKGDYQTRHGFGYSIFEHIESNIHSELCIYVALDAAVKYSVLKIRNDSKHKRQLSAIGFVAWVLGDLRSKNAMHVITELSDTGVLLACNHYNTEFGERTAFFDAITSHLKLNSRTVTGDRTEFLGRNGTQRHPEVLKRKRLSGRVGAGLDPCGGIQLTFDLEKNQSIEIIFTLGAGQNRHEAELLAQSCHGELHSGATLIAVREYWKRILGVTRVNTPDPALNILANGWLLYQSLSSRLWGRTGYYQSSGAFGFRDQLQDVMSLTHAAPELFRAHLLLCAAHQFEEGDVQHWWHPPHNRGVRTRCSDDYLWLPFVLCYYVETTGDIAILDEKVPFLQGRLLKPEEESYYDLPTIGSQRVILYQHAVRAIVNGLKFGAHGLPLIGSSDWNDGMNMVGKDGRGESVWLGFFLYSVLKSFGLLATRYGDNEFAARCTTESIKLQQQIELDGWDGNWYRRAYFDDGTPMGSAGNSECRIDSISQSWSVLSGAANPIRAAQAMTAMHDNLVNSADGLVKLLDPPFNKSIPNPGYIEGYLPGIRENGGQYTHGAIWAAMAFAKLGETQRAWQILNIINPINHGRNPLEIDRYKIEPYVVAADVYSVFPHVGRGGWSWYTGSASWLYRLITEKLLGLKLEDGKRLRLKPIFPDEWDSFSVEYKFGSAMYNISISRITDDKRSVGLSLDGVQLAENVIPLVDDGQVHEVALYLDKIS